MDDQLNIPTTCTAEASTTVCAAFVDPVDADAAGSDTSLALDRRSWLDLG